MRVFHIISAADTFHLWFFFIFGFCLHILKRANLSAASPISRGKRMRDYLLRNVFAIVIRFVLCVAVFMAWREGVLDSAIALGGRIFGATIPPIIVNAFPATHSTTLIYGFFGDSIWDWLIGRFMPSMQKELPTLPEGE